MLTIKGSSKVVTRLSMLQKKKNLPIKILRMLVHVFNPSTPHGAEAKVG